MRKMFDTVKGVEHTLPAASLPPSDQSLPSAQIVVQQLAPGFNLSSAQLGAMCSTVRSALQGVERATGELPGLAAAEWGECFDAMDPGLALVEQSLVKDASYQRFATLRAHCALSSQAACALLAELHEAIDRESGARILSRDKQFLKGVQSGLSEASALIGAMAAEHTHGVATGAEVRELQLQNRALKSQHARHHFRQTTETLQVTKLNDQIEVLTTQLAQSHQQSTQLRSRAEWLIHQNTTLLSSGAYSELDRETLSTDQLQTKLESERARRARLEHELLSAEDHIVQLLGNKQAWKMDSVLSNSLH